MFLDVVLTLMTVERRNNSYTHILKYTSLFGGVEGFIVLISIIRNKLIALILGPDGMGLMSLFNSTIKLVSDSTNFGLGMSAVRELSACYETGDRAAIQHQISVVRAWGVFTSLLGMFACVALSPVLDRWIFDWGDHSLHFALLSVIIGMAAITRVELAILKAVRKLSALAKISVYHVVGALITSIPMYYIWGETAIIPSLIVMALIQMLLTLHYSNHLYPFSISFNTALMSEGLGMIRLGIAFVLTGVIGSGADLLIRRYLNIAGSMGTVGLYNAGYMMTMTYAGIVFSSMESDFFPRLSAIKANGAALSKVVNNQIEVSLLLVAPMLVAFIVCTPILLPLLYSSEFMSIQAMVQVVLLAMYMRAIKLPIAYIPLAKGNSMLYLLMEGLYNVVLVVAVIYGYRLFGLFGTGVAITLTAVFDFCLLFFFMHHTYQYQVSSSVVRYALIQTPIGLLAFFLTKVDNPWIYWMVGAFLTTVSFIISLQILRRKTNLWEKLKAKLAGWFSV